jgi:hypothetical protein
MEIFWTTSIPFPHAQHVPHSVYPTLSSTGPAALDVRRTAVVGAIRHPIGLGTMTEQNEHQAGTMPPSPKDRILKLVQDRALVATNPIEE